MPRAGTAGRRRAPAHSNGSGGAAAAAEQAADAAEHAAQAAQAAGDAAEAAKEVAEEPAAAERAVQAGEAAELADLVRKTADPTDPVTDVNLRTILAEASPERPFGRPGPPVARRSPLRYAFSATMGVAFAALIVWSVIAARQVLILIVVALFVAVGLDPVVRWLSRRGLARGLAVGLVSVLALALVGGFVAAAVPAISKEAAQLIHQAPTYLQKLSRRHGLVGSLVRQTGLAGRAKAAGSHVSFGGGVVGIGKALLGTVVATLTVLVLIVYFLASLPSIKRLVARLVPRSRRARVGLLTEEVLRRVGGYMLGNLVTSLIAGAAMTIFLFAVGVPYPVFLGLLVALADLVPMVGALAAGVVVALVALTVSVPTAIGVVAFTAGFRLLEDYLLTPRVMRATVEVPPVATVVAVLVGGALLGIVGALLAIPVAAGIDVVLNEVVLPRQDDA